MEERPATLWTKIRALWSDEAADRVRATELHTSEYNDKEGHIPDEELERRFPFAKQNR